MQVIYVNITEIKKLLKSKISSFISIIEKKKFNIGVWIK